MVETIEGVSYTPNWEQRQEIVKILMNDYRSFIRTERGQKLMSSCKYGATQDEAAKRAMAEME